MTSLHTRRNALRIAASAAVGSLAGCLDGRLLDDPPSVTRTDAPTNAGRSVPFVLIEPGPGEEPFALFSVGGTGADDTLWIWNATDRTRRIGLELVLHDGASGDGLGTTLLGTTERFDARASVVIGLVASGEYSLRIRPEGGAESAVSVPRSRFDCNASATDVAVAADGTVETRSISTNIGCSSWLR